MTALAFLPGWAALLVALLALASAITTCIGAYGLVRLKNFYSRMHAPTLGTTLGLLLMVGATVAFFLLAQGKLALSALLIVLFVTMTTPITLTLLARAALQRDRNEGSPGVPAPPTGHVQPAEIHGADDLG